MALKKNIDLPNGITVSYWNLKELSFHKNGNLVLGIAGYLDAQARSDEKLPVTAHTIVLSPEKQASVGLPEVIDFGKLYEFIKTDEAFTGAKDA